MAFDKKRLQTFKWLEHVASARVVGLKDAFNPYKGKIIYIDGRFYANNAYMLVCAEWPELAHYRGVCEWQEVAAYMDNAGNLLKYPVLENMFEHPSNPAFFRNIFLHPNMSNAYSDSRELHITPALVIEALKGFKINNLQPGIVADAKRIQFDAHNEDISLSALVMGCR